MIDYPGHLPGKATVSLEPNLFTISNTVLSCDWFVQDMTFSHHRITNKYTGQSLTFPSPSLPSVTLKDGRTISIAAQAIDEPIVASDDSIGRRWYDRESGLELEWSASLGNDHNAVIQTIQLRAKQSVAIKAITFFDAYFPEAKQVGEVDGSVIVYEDVFMAIEHPLAKNQIKNGHVNCCLLLESELKAGECRTYTAAMGVTPPKQLRRGFLYYLEQRRIHPYRQFFALQQLV
jgi:hypothetical protein